MNFRQKERLLRPDTLNTIKCCKLNSFIAWHDFLRFGINGVSKWLIELSQSHTIIPFLADQ